MVLGLQEVDGHGQRGTARPGPEGSSDGAGHVGDEFERQGSCYQGAGVSILPNIWRKYGCLKMK